MDENQDEQLERCYNTAAELLRELIEATRGAMDYGYVSFVLDNKGVQLPVEEVQAITALIADATIEFGWCYCGECFGGGEAGEDS